jgi:hypothetical protein
MFAKSGELLISNHRLWMAYNLVDVWIKVLPLSQIFGSYSSRQTVSRPSKPAASHNGNAEVNRPEKLSPVYAPCTITVT